MSINYIPTCTYICIELHNSSPERERDDGEVIKNREKVSPVN